MLLFRQKVGSGTVCVHGLCLCLTLNEPMGTRDPSPSPFLLSLFLPPPHSTLLFYLHALWLSLFPPLLPAPNNTRAGLFVTLRAWEIPVPAIPQATHSICFQPPETKNRGPTLDQVCSTRLSQQACHYLEKEINLQIAPPHTHTYGGASLLHLRCRTSCRGSFQVFLTDVTSISRVTCAPVFPVSASVPNRIEG